MALFPYQTEAAKRHYWSAPEPLYNAFEAGLGKSATAIAVAKQLFAKRILITCPATALYSWERELDRWWPDHPTITFLKTGAAARRSVDLPQIFLASYGLMSRSDKVVAALRGGRPMDMTIIDEAHYVKNSSARRTKAILTDLKPVLGLAMPMSATPMPNHAGELYPILRSLRPDLIPSRLHPGKPMRESEFESLFCEKGIITVGDRQVEIIVGSRNIEELRTMLKGFFLVETKAARLKDLPPLRFDVLPLEIDDPQRFQTAGQLYDDGERDEDVLAAASAMANATRYAELGAAKAPAVGDYVADMLDGGTRQVVVWCIHHAPIDILRSRLAGYEVSVVDGRVSGKDRALAIDRFLAGQSRVFIGQIQAGGTAITLSGGVGQCSDEIFCESAFSPGDNLQAACRIHRIGQRNGVLARFASAVGTYDERIEEILARKAADAAALMEAA